ncbi:MAG: UpxY family transcription antiterminator [Pseudomonadota bacterium]
MPWYAVHTRSRHEDKAYAGLILKKFNAFLPKIEVWSKRKDRKKKIQLPMFAGYLFIELMDLSPETRVDVLKTFGVVKILGNPSGSEPVPVPDEKIAAIRKIINSKVEIQHFQYPDAGGRARITNGPFKGMEGTVVTTDFKKELFVITIDLLQRSVAIKLEGFQIEKA